MGAIRTRLFSGVCALSRGEDGRSVKYLMGLVQRFVGRSMLRVCAEFGGIAGQFDHVDAPEPRVLAPNFEKLAV